MFEDLHWIDAETQAVLDRLVESLPTARLLLLVNYRPEYRHDWGGKTYYRQLRLDPLAPENATALLETLLGGDASLEPLKRLLLARTEGNPFFLEESVRSLVDDGVLAGERGAYRLVKTPETVHVPATVQAILAARIDRLPAGGQGRSSRRPRSSAPTFPWPCSRLSPEVSADALADGLARLQAAEFLYETSLFPDVEYTFKHALTHEVAYGSLLQERRRALHARAVEAIEGSTPSGSRSTSSAWPTTRSGARCGRRPSAISVRPEGRRWRARPTGRRPPASSRRSTRSGIFRRVASGRSRPSTSTSTPAAPWRSAGAPAKSTEHAREAEALAEALGDERRLGRALVPARACSAWIGGRPGPRARAGASALSPSPPPTMTSSPGIGEPASRHGLADEGRVSTGRRVPPPGRGGASGRSAVRTAWERDVGTSVFAQDRLAWCLAELGEFAEAMARAEEAVRIARELDHPRQPRQSPTGASGSSPSAAATSPQAIPPLERAVELCRVTPVPVLFDISAAHLGYAYALSGRLPEGVALLEEALADPAATGSANHPLFLAYLGEAHLLAGRRDDATRGRPARPRPRAPAEGARQRGLGPAPPRRDRRAGRPSRRGVRRGRTTARPSPGPTSSACAPSSPTATSASASSTGAPATARRPRSI